MIVCIDYSVECRLEDEKGKMLNLCTSLDGKMFFILVIPVNETYSWGEQRSSSNVNLGACSV